MLPVAGEIKGIGAGRTTVRVKLAIIVGGILLLLLAGAAVYFFWAYNQAKNDPTISSQETLKRLVGEVGRIYELPTDEQPTLAQVQDPSKLGNQPFFAKAQKNDYILIYTNAKFAVLYRESSGKIINVGPVSTGSDVTPPAK